MLVHIDKKNYEIPSLQSDVEACYDQIWQGFVGEKLIQQSPISTKKFLLQIVSTTCLKRVMLIDSKNF
jgi:hypothetical protein